MNWGMLIKYAKYLPLLFDLVVFIRAAQKALADAPGDQKRKTVAQQFIQLVTTLESAGIIAPKLAEAIRNGAEAIISLIVQLMNAEQGGVEPLPDTSTATFAPDKKFT